MKYHSNRFIKENKRKKPIPNFTLEELEEKVKEFWDKMPQKQKDDMFVRELSSKEIEEKRYILGNFALSGLGDRIFRLPGGGLTGIGGLKLFEEAMRKEGENFFKR